MKDSFRTLLTLGSIRERSRMIWNFVEKGSSAHFTLYLDNLDEVCERVCRMTRRNYPDLKIPLHSRMRHFEEGIWGGTLPELYELIIPSVLLDAGAGPDYRYIDPQSQKVYTRSEALAVASFHAFKDGVFSQDGSPQTDLFGLRNLSLEKLSTAFQVREDNPLIGLEARLLVLNRFAEAMARQKDLFKGTNPRLGLLFDSLFSKAQKQDQKIPASDVFDVLMNLLLPGWPDGLCLEGYALGDVGQHSKISPGLFPFHKLTQWLCYSLLEPLQMAGVSILDSDTLTGLPEYRNGGLFLDGGVLELRDPRAWKLVYQQSDELVVEWRALTVCLLDEVLLCVRKKLSLSPDQLSMGQLLQAGTWLAGREIAKEKRPGGSPPLQIATTGTLF